MLTSNQVLGLLKAFDRPGLAGRVEALRRVGRPTVALDGSVAVSDNGAGPTPMQRRFLADALAAQPTGYVERRYMHPGDQLPARVMEASAQPGVRKPQPAALTASDVAWLQALPSDPSKVPFDDARTLLEMQRNINAGGNASDKRLVSALAGPVKDWHDQQQAESELHNATDKPFALLPASTLPALAEAISAEVPALTEPEALARADEHIQAIGQARVQARSDRIAAAQARLDELAAARADRAAVTRQS